MSNAAELNNELQQLLAEATKAGKNVRKRGLIRALDMLEQEKKQKEVKRQHRLHQEIAFASVDFAFLSLNNAIVCEGRPTAKDLFQDKARPNVLQ